jgi:hypothetical protein
MLLYVDGSGKSFFRPIAARLLLFDAKEKMKKGRKKRGFTSTYRSPPPVQLLFVPLQRRKRFSSLIKLASRYVVSENFNGAT